MARKAGKAGKSPNFSFRARKARRAYTSDENVDWKYWKFFPGVYFLYTAIQTSKL